MSNQPTRPSTTPAVVPDAITDPEETEDPEEFEVGPAASLEGYFDLDEDEQTERIREMFGFMSPNADVRRRSAETQRKRRQK